MKLSDSYNLNLKEKDYYSKTINWYQKNIKNIKLTLKNYKIKLDESKIKMVNISIFIKNILNEKYNVQNLLDDLNQTKLENYYDLIIEIYFNNLIVNKSLEFLVILYIILSKRYKNGFINLFNKNINILIKKIALKKNLNVEKIHIFNFNFLVILTLKICDYKIDINGINSFMYDLYGKIKNDKYLDIIKFSICLHNFWVPTLNFYLFNNDYNKDDSQVKFIKIIKKLNKSLINNIEWVNKVFFKNLTSYESDLNNKLYFNYDLKIKINVIQDIIFYYKEFLFVTYFIFNKKYNFNLDKYLNLAINIKELNVKLNKNYYISLEEYNYYNNIKWITKNKIDKDINKYKNNNNIKEYWVLFKNLKSKIDIKELIILLYKNKNLSNNFNNLLLKIKMKEKLYYQLIVIKNLLLLDEKTNIIFLKWFKNLFKKYDTLKNSSFNFNEIIISTIKFGIINIKIVLCYSFYLLNRLDNKIINFILTLFTECRDFFKNYESINIMVFNFLYHFLNIVKKFEHYNDYKKGINYIKKEYKIYYLAPVTKIIINYIRELISNNKCFSVNIFPIVKIMDKINKLFLSFIKDNSYERLNNLTWVILEIKVYYPEIYIYFWDNIFEYVLEKKEKNDFDNKQEILNYCITIAYCFNNNLISEKDLLIFLYTLISFEENLFKKINFNEKFSLNSFILVLITVCLKEINKKIISNPDEFYEFIFYLQVFILNLNYLDLNIEIEIISVLKNFNKKLVIIKDFNSAKIIFKEIILYKNKLSKFKKIENILIKNKRNSIIINSNNNDLEKNYDKNIIESAENKFMEEINNLIDI